MGGEEEEGRKWREKNGRNGTGEKEREPEDEL